MRRAQKIRNRSTVLNGKFHIEKPLYFMELYIMAAKLFSIIAYVTFNIPMALKSSFNAHHKANLIKLGGSSGQVSELGAKFFGNRSRLTWEETASQLKALGYEFDNARGWFTKNGIDYPHGKGTLSLSAFAWSLSALTQNAKLAQDKAAYLANEKLSATQRNALIIASQKPRKPVTVTA